MRHQAIYEIYPNCTGIVDGVGVYGLNDELITVDEALVSAKIKELKAAEPMRLLRQERTRLLQESDWVTIKAYSQGVEVSAEWKTYLQALRDLPETSDPQLDEQGNLTNVTWPERPE
jgi:hypothetical protein